jgi:hypothetical protein
MLCTEDTPADSAAEENTPTEETTADSSGDQSRSRIAKFQKLAENAATYQLNSSLDQLDPRPAPVLGHYGNLSAGKLREGYIYRIWKEDDSVMHLSTVLIILSKGTSWATCKIIRCTPKDSDYDFKHYHSKVQEQSLDKEKEIPRPTRALARLRPVTAIMDEKQGLEADCWMNLERSYDMGYDDDYYVAYCGKLTKESFQYARTKHLELYPGQSG